MRLNPKLPIRDAFDDAEDPRESQGAQIIDLATRNVLPSVTQRKPKSEVAGLAIGIAVVAAIGAVTLWSMNAARDEKRAPVAAAPLPAAGLV